MDRKIYQGLIAVLILLSACEPDLKHGPEPTLVAQKGVFVTCEGSLGTGNAALSFRSADSGIVTEDVYKAVNGTAIGDILQSITLIGEDYYLCVNNSDKVLIISKYDFGLVGTIIIPKPRYILPVNGYKAYVSTLFSDQLYVINTVTKMIEDTVFLPVKNPEGMMLSGDVAYVCCWDTANSDVIAVSTFDNSLLGSINFTVPGKAPQEILKDKNNNVWILSGDIASGTPSVLTKMNLSGVVQQVYPFPASADPLHPCFNPAKDTLYWIEANYSGGSADNGIFRMSIDETTLPAAPFIATSSFQYFWGLGIDPETGFIYVGDPKGFTQKGIVTAYNQQGAVQHSFDVGVGPGHFYFVP